jgi:hypothetical protein
MTHDPADDLVRISVRLGHVVPPEDPEDWTRPLTWMAAFGMLAGPIVALAWFLVAPPEDAATAVPPTNHVATSLAAGAAETGATQVGAARSHTATLGAGLFAALVVIILGVVMAGERQVGSASPTLAHAFAAAAAGVAGTADAAIVAGAVARLPSRLVRLVPAAISAIVVSAIVVAVLL